ncbi:MAG: hypothetical protein SPI86_01385 [Treponemataceae bacterium]|nr:hypothetical protein [Spirochaetales bacterium]MDY6030392.1 hypothetical protein [Treponemataceae bacterium]
MKKKLFIFTIFLMFQTVVFAQSSVSSSISSLKAKIKSKTATQATIELTWEIPSKNNIIAFNIYRNNEQITKENIKELEPIIILTGRYTRYNDIVTDLEKSYYYCVTTKNVKGEEFDIIIPMVNSTVIAVTPLVKENNNDKIAKKEGHVETAENERELVPLPYLNELEDANLEKKHINASDLKTAQKFSYTKKADNAKPIQILPADAKPETGDQYLLSTIVNTHLKISELDIALEQLNDFLKINRTEDTYCRAYFYLGQIYYYKGDSKNAIFAFMKSQKECPIESHQWIDEVLDTLKMD